MDLRLTKNTEIQRYKFSNLNSPRDVADLLEVKYNVLVYNLYVIPDEEKYVTFNIPKKSGGNREIKSPNSSLKILQQKLNEILQNIYKPKPSVFSYLKGKNIVSNASKHKNQKWVFNVDLKDFFPSINFGRVRGLFIGKPYYLPHDVSTVLAQICCIENQLPQGAPTSPIISNMICAKMDSEMQYLAQKNKCIYSRYADDITFSTSIKKFPERIAKNEGEKVIVGDDLKYVIESNGFEINYDKVRLLPWYTRQEVTGLTVNEFPNVPRNYIRSIRGMLHAWKKFGLANAEIEHFEKYDEKYRNPDFDLPSFKQILRGKIGYLAMVRGSKNPIYQKLKQEYDYLLLRDKGIPVIQFLNKADIDKPKILVEGKTDKIILECAWRKIYDDAPMPFVFQDSNLLGDQAGGGGTTAIKDQLNSIRPGLKNIIIGIFDYDTPGIRDFGKLRSDYVLDASEGWKISEIRNAGSLLLPIPSERQLYGEFENMCIEFYFSDIVLEKRSEEGNGLEIEFGMEGVTVGNRLMPTERSQRLETRNIKGGKVIFAEKIIQDLPSEEFENFRILFEQIFSLIDEIQQK